MAMMNSHISLNGIFPTITTPFVNHEVDYAQLRANIEKYNEFDLTGYKLLGSNAEYLGLTPDETIKVLRTVVAANTKKRTLVAGADRESVEAALDFIRIIADIGVDIASVMTPRFYARHMSDDSFVAYYTKIADDSPIPILIYIPPTSSSAPEMSAKALATPPAPETILYAKEFEKLGADFLTLLPPSYFKKQMTEAVLIKYFNDVAAAVDTPCLLYNAPQFCGGTELTVNLVKECAKNPKIVGMKDSSKGNVENFLFAVRDQICVMAGSADFFMNTLFMGGTGGVVSLANVFPGLVKELYELILAKKYEEAFKLNEKVLKLNKSVSGAGGVAAVKYAMDLAGLCGGAPRLPLLPLPEENKAKVKAALVAQGMLG
jgi:4-hydroxy-2-oxoglutarate aldolase